MSFPSSPDDAKADVNTADASSKPSLWSKFAQSLSGQLNEITHWRTQAHRVSVGMDGEAYKMPSPRR